MHEVLTQSRIEDAIDGANLFLSQGRNATLDGAVAADHVEERVVSAQEHAEGLLTAIPYPKMDGYYAPLSKFNANHYAHIVAALPGYMVLVPSKVVDKTLPPAFFPAVVSEDGLKANNLRLHVMQQPYRGSLSYTSSMVLSAAGQSETKGVGVHGHHANDGLEAEHFTTLLAAATNQNVKNAWKAGKHINHKWRKQDEGSVTTYANHLIFGKEIPQTTITIPEEDIRSGDAMLLWHEGMRNDDRNGRPETATAERALIVIQGLGYDAIKNTRPKDLDAVKDLIS